MNGNHILRHQAKGIRNRVDDLLAVYSYACLGFFILAVMVSFVLIFLGSIPTAVTLFVLSTALTGYAYSSLLQRQQHIKDITDKTIEALRSRWDELRKDQDLVKFFTSITPEDQVDAATKLKVRLYASTVLDMYALILYYINHGYFTHIEKFAAIYERMIKSLFQYCYMREVWHSRDVWGKGCLKDEYGDTLADVVSKVIEEIEGESRKDKVQSGSAGM